MMVRHMPRRVYLQRLFDSRFGTIPTWADLTNKEEASVAWPGLCFLVKIARHGRFFFIIRL